MPCEAGGEYETLTVDCPLFGDQAIHIEEWKQVEHGQDPVAPVCILVPLKWGLRRKEVERCCLVARSKDEFLSTFELVKSGASIFAAYHEMMERALDCVGIIPLVGRSVPLESRLVNAPEAARLLQDLTRLAV